MLWYANECPSIIHKVFGVILPTCRYIFLNFDIIGLPRIVAIYPLDEQYQGRDISKNRNPTGRLVGVRTGPGPDGWPNTATEFFGNANSYIEISNTGKLDTSRSITVLAWVLHLGQAGPIFNYNPGPQWGVHLWMTKPRQFFARFVKRNGRFTTPLVTHGNNVRYKAWNYIGATYDGNTGMATLWVNNRPVVRTNIGRIRLATNRPVRMGAKIGDRRYFRGRVSCVQVYSVALNRKQIINAAKRCFKRKNDQVFLILWILTILYFFVNMAVPARPV